MAEYNSCKIIHNWDIINLQWWGWGWWLDWECLWSFSCWNPISVDWTKYSEYYVSAEAPWYWSWCWHNFYLINKALSVCSSTSYWKNASNVMLKYCRPSEWQIVFDATTWWVTLCVYWKQKQTQPQKVWYIDLLVVWWWWGWWHWSWWSSWNSPWWGWWAWWYILCTCYPITEKSSIVVWAWWPNSNNWWSSIAFWLTAYGWWRWQMGTTSSWYSACPWGSWWWWSNWCWCCWQGHNWSTQHPWWWGWACSPGTWNTWWAWCQNTLLWYEQYFAAWWWWRWWYWWTWWWWNWYWVGWASAWQPWTTRGSWWWWGNCGTWSPAWWDWCQWIVVVRYKTDWSWWLCPTSAWWCKYTCWEYTIHCFVTTGYTDYFVPVFK